MRRADFDGQVVKVTVKKDGLADMAFINSFAKSGEREIVSVKAEQLEFGDTMTGPGDIPDAEK